MFNYFDIFAFIAIVVGGYLGYLIGVFVGLYLLLLCAGIIALVKTVFTLEKMKAYIVLFVSTMVISVISVSVFGLVFGEFFKRPVIKRLNHLLGAVVAVVGVLILFRAVVLPASLALSESFHQSMTASYTMNNLAPLVEGILPGVQETLWNDVDGFLKSLSPKPPEEESAPDGKKPQEKSLSQRVKEVKQLKENPWGSQDK